MGFLTARSADEIVSLSTPKDIREAHFVQDENGMYLLTKENAKKALACIEANPRYKDPSYSVAYQERKARTGRTLIDYDPDEMTDIIKKIAVSNSTRSSGQNIRVIAAYIGKDRTRFLHRSADGDIALVEELAHLDGLTRREESLSSKVCAYLSQLEFGQSRYAISDSVVRQILPYYLLRYGIAFKNPGAVMAASYTQVAALIGAVAGQLPRYLAYHEIDRILWYGYRDDPVRCAIAQAIVKNSTDRS